MGAKRKATTEELDIAFNQGCDTRLAGRPDTDNPYSDEELLRSWNAGWHDVHRNWGRWLKVKPKLVEVPTGRWQAPSKK